MYFAKDFYALLLRDAFHQYVSGGRPPVELILYHYVTCGSVGKLLVLLPIGIGPLVDNEIDDGYSPISFDNEHRVMHIRDFHDWFGVIGLVKELDRGLMQVLNENSCWDHGSLGAELGEDVGGDVLLSWDEVDLQAIELVFELADLSAVGVHDLLPYVPLFTCLTTTLESP